MTKGVDNYEQFFCGLPVLIALFPWRLALFEPTFVSEILFVGNVQHKLFEASDCQCLKNNSLCQGKSKFHRKGGC